VFQGGAATGQRTTACWQVRVGGASCPRHAGVPQIDVPSTSTPTASSTASAKDKATRQGAKHHHHVVLWPVRGGHPENGQTGAGTRGRGQEAARGHRGAQPSERVFRSALQKHFDENKDKIPSSERQGLEDALKDAKTTLESNREASDAEVFKGAFERLEKASHKMAEALYKAAGGSEGAQAGAAPSGGDGKGTGGKDDVYRRRIHRDAQELVLTGTLPRASAPREGRANARAERQEWGSPRGG